MASRFFFHSPDGRIYGPADLATLQRWRAEGRVRDDSEIREEREGPRTTFAEVAARKPEPEPLPAAVTPPVLPPIPPAAPDPVVPLPFMELVARSWSLYARNLGFFWTAAVVVQVPLFAYLMVWLRHFVFSADLKTVSEGPLSPHQAAVLLALLLLTYLANALGSGFFALAVVRAGQGERPGWASIWRDFSPRLLSVAKTWLLGLGIISSLVFLFGFADLLLAHAPIPVPVRTFLELVLLFPILFFSLRYLLSPQIVVLDRLDGLLALKRSNDLIRIRPGRSPLATGDFRLLGFGIVAMMALFCFIVPFAILFSPLVAKGVSTAMALIIYFSAATAMPFLAIALTLFALDARKRLPEKPPARPQG